MKNILIIAGLFLALQMTAQQPQPIPVKQGKNGIYILLSDRGFSEKEPLFGKFTSALVQRAVNDDKYKELGRIVPASGPDEFEKIIAKEALMSVAELKELKNKQEAWQYVQLHPQIKDYGILALEMNLGVALGAFFLDKDAASLPAGSLVKYKIILSGPQEKSELTGQITVSKTAPLQKPFFVSKSESDSVITIEWAALKSQSPDIMFGNVYAMEGNPAQFKPVQRLFANNDERGDTVRFRFTHFVKPGIQFQYYLKPATMAMLEGPASDTVIATSVNFAVLDQPLELKAVDTTNGIYLSWKLSQNTYARKSIIVERSAGIDQPFKTVAVLPSFALSYTDFTPLPSVSYLYRVRIATIANTILPPSSHVPAHHQLRGFSPEAPFSVNAAVQQNGVLITWNKVRNLDVAGYYVSRNNGIDSVYDPVSLLVRDTFFLDTTRLYGRNNYTWAVRTYTMSDMSSANSYSASTQVGNAVRPQAPSGGRSYAQPGLVHISWDDTKLADPYIKGYVIYRKAGDLKPGNLGYLDALKQAGFEKIATSGDNAFTDALKGDGKYNYAVTSVDIFGKESDVGFIQTLETKAPYVAVPEQFSVRKTSKGITIDWDIVKQEGVRSYIIYKRSASEVKAVKLTTVDIAKGSYTDTNVKAGTLYYYSLSATGDYGTSAPSAEKFAKF